MDQHSPAYGEATIYGHHDKGEDQHALATTEMRLDDNTPSPEPDHAAACTGSPGPATPSDCSRASSVDHGQDDNGVGRVPGQNFTDLTRLSAPTAGSSPRSGSAGVRSGKKALSEHESLHAKARGLASTKIDGNRYLVAVLGPDLKARDIRKERDFVWLRGHGVSHQNIHI